MQDIHEGVFSLSSAVNTGTGVKDCLEEKYQEKKKKHFGISVGVACLSVCTDCYAAVNTSVASFKTYINNSIFTKVIQDNQMNSITKEKFSF